MHHQGVLFKMGQQVFGTAVDSQQALTVEPCKVSRNEPAKLRLKHLYLLHRLTD